jgi:hypothetical protein
MAKLTLLLQVEQKLQFTRYQLRPLLRCTRYLSAMMTQLELLDHTTPEEMGLLWAKALER